MLTRMLEVALLAEGEGGNQGATASTKEDDRGRKRTASEDPEAEASKREKKSPTEGPASGVLLPHKVREGINSPASRK